MSQIKQLIRLYQSGSGIKTIARILGMSKNTVKSYLKKMADGGFNTEDLLKQEDPLLEKSFHAGMITLHLKKLVLIIKWY
ncbi:helix-turn-helix domain-containing protein [Sphingobacterium zeae]|nr:helix-turn-helix domain-containing protein [Sphingobacterium zeae]